MQSHPSWVRGLKLLFIVLFFLVLYVAPLVGAWIETTSSQNEAWKSSVAPLVGAWIETKFGGYRSVPDVSRTPRGCVD